MEPIDYFTAGLGLFGSAIGLMNWSRSRGNVKISIDDAREARKLTNSSEFLKEYYSPDFMKIRSAAWLAFDSAFTYPVNQESLTQIAYYLLGSSSFDPSSLSLPPPSVVNNGLTPLQNISLLVNFWHRLTEFGKTNMINAEVISPLRHEYRQWDRFINPIAEACDVIVRSTESPRLIPPWLSKMSSIESIVWGDGSTTNKMLERSGDATVS